ncbi:Os11g0300275 [Oryza sativa Japonica Group]|uniref:Os11g0300275 protein n=1 Tax=Oryza sativa subsp. japonica TaxID=39947 RepID=A3CAP3_ORYSJ|nr:hypothetical protein OsJ_33705 [Oryza sativa Japonica Group]BAH95214.1 Os11g0300275 [Oryza sativa Japonica Group]|eukprot:NP_001176486.1 Os11g0300275 [Oryza sativa Japonica Group]
MTSNSSTGSFLGGRDADASAVAAAAAGAAADVDAMHGGRRAVGLGMEEARQGARGSKETIKDGDWRDVLAWTEERNTHRIINHPWRRYLRASAGCGTAVAGAERGEDEWAGCLPVGLVSETGQRSQSAELVRAMAAGAEHSKNAGSAAGAEMTGD